MINWQDFELWMTEEKYRDSTIRTGVPDAKRFVHEVEEGRAPSERLTYAGYRLRAYAMDRALRLNPHLHEALKAARKQRQRKRRGGRNAKSRKNEAQSMTDAEWRRLWNAVLEDDTTAARVIELQMATGLRIADVLRITRRSVTNAMDSGIIRVEVKGGGELVRYIDGAPEAWGHLLQAWQGKPGTTVALLLVPDGDGSTHAGDAPYKRVSRRLKTLAKKAGVESRVHTHRLRRTVAVQALRLTDNVHAVQQLMGHKSLNTTVGYVDEARPERVAELQRELRDRFTNEETG